MIGSFFRVLFFTLLVLVLGWPACLSDPSFLERTTACDLESYRASFPWIAGRRAPPGNVALPPLIATIFPVRPETLGSALNLVRRRLTVSAGLAPFLPLFLTAAVAAGMLLRERLRHGTTYASPTVSFLSKRLGEAAAVLFLAWNVTPLPLPYWVFYPAMAAAMAGAFGYVANLPLRL
jgi:hypothetical protein